MMKIYLRFREAQRCKENLEVFLKCGEKLTNTLIGRKKKMRYVLSLKKTEDFRDEN